MARNQRWIALDQLVNTFITDGWADETLSARCWRMGVIEGSSTWNKWRKRIDAIAWRLFKDVNHCQMAYIDERVRLQSPPEER